MYTPTHAEAFAQVSWAVFGKLHSLHCEWRDGSHCWPAVRPLLGFPVLPYLPPFFFFYFSVFVRAEKDDSLLHFAILELFASRNMFSEGANYKICSYT